MRVRFSGFYRPSEAEFQDLWEQCVFVFDASALLNLYAYSGPTRLAFLRLLEKLETRVWLPYQFASEFQKNRAKAILDQVTNYASVVGSLKRIFAEEFVPTTKHPFLSARLIKSYQALLKELEKSQQAQEALLRVDPYYIGTL